MSAAPEISAVVCTRNRADCLPACIESLTCQSLDSDRYEIIVVDNGSTDRTRDICGRYLGLDNFVYLHEPVAGLSQARNTGWRAAKGDYVGYIDDDAAADRGWLETALACFGLDPEPAWVGGPVTLVWEQDPPAWLTEDYFGALGWVDWGGEARCLDPEHEWLVGCNSLFARRVLEEQGGFDTRLGRKEALLLSGEEVQLHHRLRAAGGTFYYHPDVHVRHRVAQERATPGYFYRRYYWGGITDYVMARTLAGMPAQSDPAADASGSRFGRLAANGLNAIGLLVPVRQRVQGRIYMSYVVGRLAAMLKYGWRTTEPTG